MGLFDSIKQAKDVMKMRSEAKKIETAVKAITAEYANGGISVIAKGDMTIERIAVSPEAYDEVKAGKPQHFETMLLNVVNGALNRVKAETQRQMAEMMQAGGMGGLFGQ